MRAARILSLSLAASLCAGAAAAAADRYLMTAFTNGSQKALSVYASADGLNFHPLAEKAYTPPAGLLRDPSVIHRDGWWYIAYTTDWNGRTIGLARSRDARTWEHLTDLTLPLEGVTNTWAPEWFVDEDGSTYLVVSLSRTGAAGQFQPHLLKAEDASLTRWSAPKPLSGLGPNHIDAFVVRSGARYHAFVKNETSKYVEHWTAIDLEGPWQAADVGDWAGWGKNREGPALLKLPDGGWRIFLDGYTEKKLWFSDSHDGFRTWTSPKELPGLSGQARHFTVLDEQAASPKPGALTRRITWDSHSLMIDGKRTWIWSGEFHPYRLPSPDLWRDVLQKMKASGYNAVSIYFDWGYHTPKQGLYDFSGVRDMDRVLQMAKEEGLWVIARTGPYVNAELSRGGFPGWLVNQTGKARTDAPDYVAAAEEWMTQIDAVVARHQLDAGGTVIAYQIENELAAETTQQQRYMRWLYDKVRSDGITVPIFHNDIGRNGRWVPASSDVPGVVHGPNDLYAFDGYPGGSCTPDGKLGRPNPAPDWGFYGPEGARGGAKASPGTPGFTAEFGGGWFDFWGSAGLYECNSRRTGPGYERVFYGANIANGLTIHNVYMGFGGTSWGWLPAPVVFTSYDYGAGIDEARGLRPKAYAMKQLGEFVQSVADLTEMQPATALEAPEGVRLYHNANRRTGAHLYVAAQNSAEGALTTDVPITVETADGTYQVAARLRGQDARLLLAAYGFGGQRLVYSTSQLQTQMTHGGRDLALVWGMAGDPGETVLRYASAPRVEVLAGEVRSAFDAAKGDLKLAYAHQGLAQVRITGGGRPPLLLLIADEATAQRYWKLDTPAGPVLAGGPALVRTAAASGSTLSLTGDTEADSPLQVFAPDSLKSVRWNGQPVATTRTPAGALLAARPLAGPQAIALPDLSKLSWRRQAGSPEAQPGFDDSAWIEAKAARTASTTKPPAGQPVLDMSAYGFHSGDVWYRGRYTGAGAETSLTFRYGAGGAGLIQVWLDGRFLGQSELESALPRPPTTGAATFQIPAELRGGQHVVSVMVRNDGHNWDLDVDDAHKEARGLISASIDGPGGQAFTTPIAWRIQGARGGEELFDKVRGPMNNGGQYGERMGWHLPGFQDAGWTATSASDGEAAAGTTWRRTRFRLAAPKGHDLSLGLAFGDPSIPRSPSAKYRVLIFLNGWNLGQFIAHVGPQRTFVLPSGLLDLHGENTLALAVTSDGAPGNALEPVKLVNLRTVRGGVPVGKVPSPAYADLFNSSARKE